jgi:hypothetical protein
MAEKYCTRPRLADLRDGDRIVVDSWLNYAKDGEHERAPRAVVTLHAATPLYEVSRGGHVGAELPYALSEDGQRFDIVLKHGSLEIHQDNRKRHALWTRPLPNLPDDEVFVYVDAFLGKDAIFRGRIDRDDPHDPNCTFIIDRIDGQHAVGRMVTWADDTQDDYLAYLEKKKADDAAFPDDDVFHYIEALAQFPETFRVDGHLAVSSFEVRIPTKQLPDVVEPGSLVVGSSFWIDIKKGLEITTVAKAAIAGNVRTRPLEDYFPRRENADRPSMIRRNHESVELARIQDFLKEANRAKAKLEPDEILLAIFPTDKEADICTSTSILSFGARGAVFFEGDGEWIESIAAGHPDPGLWMYKEARPWASYDSWTGEHDGGIEGDWHPATIEDVIAFGNDPETLAVELAANYEGADYENSVAAGTFFEDMMRLAREACVAKPVEVTAEPTPIYR